MDQVVNSHLLYRWAMPERLHVTNIAFDFYSVKWSFSKKSSFYALFLQKMLNFSKFSDFFIFSGVVMKVILLLKFPMGGQF